MRLLLNILISFTRSLGVVIKKLLRASYIILKGKHTRNLYSSGLPGEQTHCLGTEEPGQPDADTREPLREIESLYETTSLSLRVCVTYRNI